MSTLKITDFSNPSMFVDRWSSSYNLSQEHKYLENIKSPFASWSAFEALFQWKNQTGDQIAEGKLKTLKSFWDQKAILKRLQDDFNWKTFEDAFKPKKSATIWKCLLLHLIKPSVFPLYDQHVYRSYQFITKGKIEEIPNSGSKKYLFYKENYMPWFNELVETYNLNPKKLDEAIFEYGRFIKAIKNYPIEIV
jgi:hypothetical protein